MAQADIQLAYRARQSERYERRGQALQTIIDRLDGNAKPLATEIRGIAQRGLAKKPE